MVGIKTVHTYEILAPVNQSFVAMRSATSDVLRRRCSQIRLSYTRQSLCLFRRKDPKHVRLSSGQSVRCTGERDEAGTIERSDTNRELRGQMCSVGSNRRARLLREEKIGQPTAFRKLTAQRFDEKHFEGVNTFSGKA